MVDLKIVQIGNSLGVRLPRHVLKHMRLENGDHLILTESADGGYRLTPYDPEFERLVPEQNECVEALPSRVVGPLADLDQLALAQLVSQAHGLAFLDPQRPPQCLV